MGKKNLEIIFALFITKILVFTLRNIFRTNATSLPGKLLLKFFPKFPNLTNERCKNGIITITGTNGKTTTSGLIAEIFDCNNKKIVHNAQGANMLTGVVTALASQLPLIGKVDNFIFESDEAYLSKIYDHFDAEYLVVTNLFRDQLDRYGELATTAKKIKDAILKNPKLKVLLNADDPTLLDLAVNENTTFYGFESLSFEYECKESMSPPETATCKCGKDFCYTQRFYSHIGHYGCSCGITRQKPKYNAKAKIYKDYTEIFLNDELKFKVFIPNIYNAYNALAAISLALENGIAPQVIQNALDKYKPAFGRAERKVVRGKKLFIQLIKNPTGATEVLRTISSYSENSVLLIAINDNYADGRDVSWLWDTDFEILKSYPNKIIVTGTRALDMALRLKYAEFDNEKLIIEPSLKQAYNLALNSVTNDDQLLIMPTYTALLELDKYK